MGSVHSMLLSFALDVEPLEGRFYFHLANGELLPGGSIYVHVADGPCLRGIAVAMLTRRPGLSRWVEGALRSSVAH
jgi:hypothetical protein